MTSYLNSASLRCFVHPAKSSVPFSVCLSFGTLSSRSFCFGGGILLGDRDLDLLLPLPLPRGSGSPPGDPSGLPVGLLLSSCVTFPLSVLCPGFGVRLLPTVWVELCVPLSLAIVDVRVYWNSSDFGFGLNSDRGDLFLGLNTPLTTVCSRSSDKARRGERACRNAIYLQRQRRSYLRQSHCGIVASCTKALYLSRRSLEIFGSNLSSLCTMMVKGIS